jgi:methyl-accepting chemotaxis protein
MRFRDSAPRVLIVAIVLVVAAMALLSNRLFSGMTSAVESDQLALMRSVIDFNVKGAENRALARAELIAGLPNIRTTFAARDRDKLLAEMQEVFGVQKERHGVDQAQFHLPPATSFLRLQAPTQFGDDLSLFRPMVVTVNREQSSRKGLAIARTGPAIFGVAPVFDLEHRHVGSFEFGVDFGSILDSLKVAYDFDLALFIVEEPLREFAKGVKPEVLSESNRVGKYIKFHSTNWDLMKPLATELDLAAGTDAQYSREARGVPYGVILVPLRNAAGEAIGMIAVARDFSQTRAAARRSLVWQALLAVFAIVLLAAMVLVTVRGLLLRPLDRMNDGFSRLADGRPAEPMENAEELCAELRQLAHSHDRLAARGDRRES